MWTKINQVYVTPHDMNVWAHVVATNKWHKTKPIASSGVTNVAVVLAAAKANDKQVNVGLEASTSQITAVYL